MKNKTGKHSTHPTILSETIAGDFSNFDDLAEEMQNELMSKWDDDTQLKFLSREPTMSQQEFYEQLDKIANGTFGKGDT